MSFIFPVLNENVYALPFYIQELGSIANQDHIIRDKAYPNNQLLICTAGKGRLIIEGKEHIISKGDVFFTKKNIPHEYYGITQPWSIQWIVFDGTSVGALFNQLDIYNYAIFEIQSLQNILKIFDDIMAILQSNNLKKHIESSILIYALITKLSYFKRMSDAIESKSKKQESYENILNYIEKHYAQDLSLASLSEKFDLSSYYICRLFKEFNKTGLITHLTQYRISMAKTHLLLTPTASIKSIAAQIGFSNSSYFISTFKKFEGMTPLMFRQVYGHSATK